MQGSGGLSYLRVLGAAVCCYAALGAVVRITPQYVHGELGGTTFLVGLAIGAPALTAVFARPLGGRLADARGAHTVVVAGSIAMAAASGLLFIDGLGPFIASRLLVGIGEGAMMAATVLWLLRLAGPDRRGQALGHIGLANYAGLTAGPLLAEALGGAAHAERVFAAALVLPLLPCVLVAGVPPGRAPDDSAGERAFRELFRLIVRPGVGLLLVNVGYAALLSFGAEAVGTGTAGLVLPAYAITVIAVRTFAGAIPDRWGGRKTLTRAAPTAAAGLLAVALAPGAAGALIGVVVLGVGQGLAVPALGLLALERVPASQHGAASGVFFAWFDAGVGLGGPFAGLAAGIGGPSAALVAAACAVALATGVRGSRAWPRDSAQRPLSTSR